MQERITLKDVAKALGVSIGTVERAMHGKSDINADTRQRVLEKIEEMKYLPNRHARSLSLKSRKNITVLMPYNAPFWHQMRAGIECAGRELSFCGVSVNCVCLNRMDGNLVLSHVKEAVGRKTDGFLLVPEGLGPVAGKIRGIIGDGIPLGMLNDDEEAFGRQFYVGPDNLLIGRLAGELVGKFSAGRGKCMAITAMHAKSGALSPECRLRLTGFQEVLCQAYPDIELDVATYEMYSEDAYNVTLGKLAVDGGMQSVYSVDGFLQETAMAVKDSGRRGLVLVGHEMSEDVNRLLQEGTISAAICQNPYLQGYHALKCMADYLLDRKKPPHEKMFIDFHLYTRYNTYGKDNYLGAVKPVGQA